jgi:hypothetical protein
VIYGDHNKPPGRAPAGKGLLCLALMKSWCQRHHDDDDETLARLSVEWAGQLLNGPIDVRVVCYPDTASRTHPHQQGHTNRPPRSGSTGPGVAVTITVGGAGGRAR